MLKVLAAVLAVLSAAISITIYTATLPAIQKQAADNAAAVETLGGAVSDNAEAIEQNAEAIETLENSKLYQHYITINSNNGLLFVNFVSNEEYYSVNLFIEYLNNNQFTDENNVIGVTGRVYSGSSGSHMYGLYTSGDDLYAVNIGTSTLTLTSNLLENVSLSDTSILLN